jgi:hypothetical protein
MRADTRRAKAELQQHVTAVRMMPQADHYVAEGLWDLPGHALPANQGNFGMVAGARFELATFGL